MLEFYCAYMDVNGNDGLLRELIRSSAFTVTGHTHARWGEHEIDFLTKLQKINYEGSDY